MPSIGEPGWSPPWYNRPAVYLLTGFGLFWYGLQHPRRRWPALLAGGLGVAIGTGAGD